MSKLRLPKSGQASLQRLNGDTAWLLALPTYEDSGGSSAAARTWTLAIDPWLDGAGSTSYHPSFSREVRAVPAIAPSLAALDEEIGHLRIASREHLPNDGETTDTCLDAVLAAFEFTDHAHPESLAGVPASVSLFTTQNAAKQVQRIASRHPYVVAISSWDSKPSWDDPADSALPSNIRLLTVPAREGWHPAWPRLHNALLIMWRKRAASSSEGASWREQYLLYSPHGIEETSLPPWLTQIECVGYLAGWDSHRIPCKSSLAFCVHGDTCISLLTASGTTLTTALSDILGDKVQLGLEPAIRIVGKTRAARLINTHDEPKRAQGLISYLSTIQPLGGLTVGQALRVNRGDPDDQRQQAAQLILNEHVKMGQYRANADATPFKPTALAVPAGSVLDLA